MACCVFFRALGSRRADEQRLTRWWHKERKLLARAAAVTTWPAASTCSRHRKGPTHAVNARLQTLTGSAVEDLGVQADKVKNFNHDQNAVVKNFNDDQHVVELVP